MLSRYKDHPPDELGLDLLDGVLGDLVGGGYQLLVVLHGAALLALFLKCSAMKFWRAWGFGSIQR